MRRLKSVPKKASEIGELKISSRGPWNFRASLGDFADPRWGGPLKKDRLYFFFRNRMASTMDRLETVPLSNIWDRGLERILSFVNCQGFPIKGGYFQVLVRMIGFG